MTHAVDDLVTAGAAGVGERQVLRCLDCGDVFPVEESADVACPSCGGRRLRVAGEPLL